MNNNIGIIGVGKLGLCLALNLEKKGYNVLAVDTREEYILELNNKTFNSNEPGVNELLKNSVNFKATTSLKDVIDFSDTLFVMVATPSLPNGKYDHKQIDSVITNLNILGPQKETKNLIIGCTTYPGYCDSIINELNNLNYNLLYNPEFIAQGNILYGQEYPDMVLIGESSLESGDKLEEIHKKLCNNSPIISRMSLTEAEITKLAINCFITTKISFANMIGDLCNKLKVSHDRVLNSVGSDSRIGNKYLGWGYGFGGPCFPRDNRALGILCKENGIEPSIPKASDEYNKLHLNYMVHNMDLLYSSSNINEIELDGVSYKNGSVLIEESQQLEVAIRMVDRGYDVVIKDNEIVIEQVKNLYGDKFKYVIK